MATLMYEYYQCGEWNLGVEYEIPISKLKSRVKELSNISAEGKKKKYRKIKIL